MDTTTKTRIVQNTVFVLIAQITNIFLQMVYLVVAARYLGNVQFGKLSFAMAFTQMFLAVTDLGLFNYAVKEISRKKEAAHRYFINLFVLKLLLGICVLTIIAFIISILNYPRDTIITTYLLSLGLCLFSLNTTFHAVFQSYERLEYISMTMILFFVINVSLAIIALFMGKNIITLACINCIAGIVVFITNLFILCKKFFIPKLTIDLPFCKEMLFYSLPIGIGAVCWSFYNRIDVSLLSFMKGDVSVGEYTAAYRLTNTLAFIPSAYMSAIFPIMAKQYIDTPTPLLNTLCQKSCKLMIIIALPVAMTLTLRAPAIINLLYGKAYGNAVNSLRILSWTILFTFISNIFSYLLISTFKTSKEYTLYAVMGLVLNVACNCLFIPMFDLNGAAISTVITEAFIFMLYYRSIKKKGFCIPLFKLAIRPFAASLPIIWILYFWDTKNIFVTVSVSIIVYFSILIMIKGIKRDETKEVWGILKNFHAYRH
ncbi:MAG: flippase [Planctomycetia bacterium]|nr:flippase [Planctomycetia bacterium]